MAGPNPRPSSKPENPSPLESVKSAAETLLTPEKLQTLISSIANSIRSNAEAMDTLQKNLKLYRSAETADQRNITDLAKSTLGSYDSLTQRKYFRDLNTQLYALLKCNTVTESFPMDDSAPEGSVLNIIKDDSHNVLTTNTNLMGRLYVNTQKDPLLRRNAKGKKLGSLSRTSHVYLDPAALPKVFKNSKNGNENLFVGIQDKDGNSLGYCCAKFLQTNTHPKVYTASSDQVNKTQKQLTEIPTLQNKISATKTQVDNTLRSLDDKVGDEQFQKIILKHLKVIDQRSDPLHSIPYNFPTNFNQDSIKEINTQYTNITSHLKSLQELLKALKNYNKPPQPPAPDQNTTPEPEPDQNTTPPPEPDQNTTPPPEPDQNTTPPPEPDQQGQSQEAITYSENLNTIQETLGGRFTEEEISQIIDFQKLQQIEPDKTNLATAIQGIKEYISDYSEQGYNPKPYFNVEGVRNLKRLNIEIRDNTEEIHSKIQRSFGNKYNLFDNDDRRYKGTFIEGGEQFNENSYIKSISEASPSKRREYFNRFKQFANKLTMQNNKYSESLKSLHFLSKMPNGSTAETYKKTFQEIDRHKDSLGPNAKILMHKLVNKYIHSNVSIPSENLESIYSTSVFASMKEEFKTIFYLKSELPDKVTSTDSKSKSMVEVYNALQENINLLQKPSSTPIVIITFLKDKIELTESNIQALNILQETLNIRNPILSRLLRGLKSLGGTHKQKVDFIEKLYQTAQKGQENQITLEYRKFKITLTNENNIDSTKEFNFQEFTIKSQNEITYKGSIYKLKDIASGRKQWQKQT